ncbi:F-box domain containing protein [Parasponia andersonii]|uniref:F-box domain containing protein n=1 Tax=Parasponia andersonii TaxID=3476 RepID=A0A2P5C512_PARAD|nr:F-box domain containing protein [Parasponia andersonii]
MASFSNLPEDVVVEIMSRLPPESLLRFKCVQKSWHVLIKALVRNPIFVKKHLYNSSNKISCLFFKCSENNITNRQGILTISDDEDSPSRYLTYVAKEFVPSLSLFGSKFYCPRAHCDGIICQFSDRNILLCNPSTMEYKLLPGPCFDDKPLWRIRYVGFGYDAIDDVYKIVRVYRCFGLIRADVFNLGSDCWREFKMKIESGDDELSYYFGEEQVYCKGVYYWMMREVSSLDEKIRSFDMHDEEFHTISLPHHFRKRIFSTKLTQWKGSLALFYYRKSLRLGRNPIEVWFYDNKMDESDLTRHYARWTLFWLALLNFGMSEAHCGRMRLHLAHGAFHQQGLPKFNNHVAVSNSRRSLACVVRDDKAVILIAICRHSDSAIFEGHSVQFVRE